MKRDHKKEKHELINGYTTDIELLNASLTKKCNEVKLLRSELNLVKEFRRKRAQMQKEIADV